MRLILNGLIRILSVLPKLFLTFYLLKKWDLAEIGRYNLLNTNILILTLIVGLDFYNYSNRELVKNKSTNRGTILIRQIVLYIIAYFLLIPPLYYFVLKYYLADNIIISFFIILICEHLSQEIYRILNVLEFQIFASILLALRNGLWICLLFIYVSFTNDSPLTIEILLKFWSGGSTVCLIISVFILIKKINIILPSFRIYDSLIFYRKALKITSIYFFITVIYKFLEYSGRYIIAYYFDPKILGVYSVFYQVSGLMSLLFDSTIITFLYPKLIKYFNDAEMNNINITVTNNVVNMLLLGFFEIIVCYSFRRNIYSFFNKPELENFDMLLILILTSNLVYSLSYIYHYALYAMQDDKGIFKTVFFSFLINFSSFLLIPLIGIYSVAIGSLFSYIALLFFKYYRYKKTFSNLTLD